MEKIRVFFQNKRNLIITLVTAGVILLAAVTGIVVWSLGNKGPAPDASPMANVSEEPSEPEVSVPEISSAPAVSIADIAPVVSSEPETSSDKETSSAPAKKAESQASSQLAVTGTPESVPEPKPESKEEKTPVKEDPKPNPTDYAKTPNRNPPSFSVDNTIEGPGGWHGDFDGDSYYHAGMDTWLDEETWKVYRFGEHPEATWNDVESLNNTQFSPFQLDGDYIPRHQCYYCATCHTLVYYEGWENGVHFAGNPNHSK